MRGCSTALLCGAHLPRPPGGATALWAGGQSGGEKCSVWRAGEGGKNDSMHGGRSGSISGERAPAVQDARVQGAGVQGAGVQGARAQGSGVQGLCRSAGPPPGAVGRLYSLSG